MNVRESYSPALEQGTLLGTPWPPLYNAAIVTELTETACNDCEEE